MGKTDEASTTRRAPVDKGVAEQAATDKAAAARAAREAAPAQNDIAGSQQAASDKKVIKLKDAEKLAARNIAATQAATADKAIAEDSSEQAASERAAADRFARVSSGHRTSGGSDNAEQPANYKNAMRLDYQNIAAQRAGADKVQTAAAKFASVKADVERDTANKVVAEGANARGLGAAPTDRPATMGVMLNLLQDRMPD